MQNNRIQTSTRITALASFATIVACTVGAALVPAAGAQSVSSMQSQIQSAQSKLSQKQAKASSLSTTISGLSARIDGLQGGITRLRTREAEVQLRLDNAVTELRSIQSRHRTAAADLARLKARLAKSRHILARRLVELYQSDRPDQITVVLHSDGFAQLIEDKEFLGRIGSQDRLIVTTVKRNKASTQTLTQKLAGMEKERQAVAATILQSRNEVDSVRSRLEARQQKWADARSARQQALDTVHQQTKHLKERIDVLQSDINAVSGQLQSSNSNVAGPVNSTPGRFIWPVNGPITSPFCERRAWEACHPGIDIGVPSGTAIHAAGTGVVQIAGWEGGYGNYTCIGHGGGVSTCYGHQSQIEVSVGQHVTKGQVIGLSGCTGLCFGAHLHFEVRVNGAVTNPVSWL